MDSFLLGGTKVPSAKFEKVGDEYTLTITEEPELKQQTDYDDGTPLVWADGSPRLQLVVTGQIDESQRDGGDDDGMRRYYLKGESQKAAGQALRDAGVKTLAINGKLWMKFTGEEKNGKKVKKLYKAAYKAPEQSATSDFLGTGGSETSMRAPAGKADDSAPPF
jgi:hypothetical protein